MGITDRNKPLTAEEVPATRKVADSRRYMLRGAVKWLFHGRTVNRRYTATDRFYLMQWPNVAEKYCQVMEANESKGCMRTLEPGEIDDCPLEFFIVFMLRNSKKYSRGKYNGCSRIQQISPLEETTIFTVIFFSIADVKARKNFACINFVVCVDSYRQVKL